MRIISRSAELTSSGRKRGLGEREREIFGEDGGRQGDKAS